MKIILCITTLFFCSELFGQLNEVVSFGSNPGNLKCYEYVPTSLPTNPALVVVAHGCTQNAQEIADRTEWNQLADDFGFILLYPEQQSINNSSTCFNWFLSFDNEKGTGEVKSLKNMVDFFVATYNIDTTKIYMTGVSAGAAFTTNMGGCYPETFEAVASIAGGPYKSATGFADAATAMNPGFDYSPSVWGNKVRNQNPTFTGEYPRMLILHGTNDPTVNWNNSRELTDQWTDVHQIDTIPEDIILSFNGNSNVWYYNYQNGVGDTLVEKYIFNGLGHAIPVDPGTGSQQGGTTGAYAVDFNFYSTYWVADFFGLITQPNGIDEQKHQILLQFISNNHLLVPSEQGELVVFDLSGKIIESIMVSTSSINLNHLPPGGYVFQFSSSETIIRTKGVILK